MKWKSNSLYRVKINFKEEEFSLSNLIYNYQPLIGSDAVSLYLFLYSESNSGISKALFLSQERILKITNLIKEEAILAFSKLELFSLIKVYFSKENDRFIYSINPPLSIDYLENNFINDFIIKRIGIENFKINSSFLTIKKIENITDETYELQEINSPILINKSMKITKEWLQLNVNIDLTPLLNLLYDEKIDYLKWWNNNIEHVISEAIVLYDLTFLDVFFVLQKIVELNKNDLVDIIQFQDKVRKIFKNNQYIIEKILKDKENNVKKANLLRILPSLQFLTLRLKRSPSTEEITIINQLKKEFNLKEEAINVLLDYSILKTKRNIDSELILSIASLIKKNNITSAQETFKLLKKINLKTSSIDKQTELDYYSIEQSNETIEFVTELFNDNYDDSSLENSNESSLSTNNADFNEEEYNIDEDTSEIENIEKIINKFIG